MLKNGDFVVNFERKECTIIVFVYTLDAIILEMLTIN